MQMGYNNQKNWDKQMSLTLLFPQWQLYFSKS